MYCPKCGQKELKWDQEKKLYCPTCYFVLYHNIASAVAVVVKYGRELLFAKRNCDPAKGKLDLTGGFTDPNESAEATCKRELYEELKWDIDPEKLKYITSLPNTYLYKDILYNTLDLFFLYEVDEKPKFDLEKEEISEVEWREIATLDLDELAFDSQKKFFSLYHSLLK
jgi:NADH pyrophosphatase NudC (nudix superfamily)